MLWVLIRKFCKYSSEYWRMLQVLIRSALPRCFWLVHHISQSIGQLVHLSVCDANYFFYSFCKTFMKPLRNDQHDDKQCMTCFFFFHFKVTWPWHRSLSVWVYSFYSFCCYHTTSQKYSTWWEQCKRKKKTLLGYWYLVLNFYFLPVARFNSQIWLLTDPTAHVPGQSWRSESRTLSF